MASFSVLAMVKARPEELRAFIAHYRAHGAERLLIYNDGPIDALVAAGLEPAALAAQGVALVALDDAFWAAAGKARPADFIARRTEVHRIGKAACPSEWLFICDEDEFLRAERPVGALLERIPGDVDAVILAMAEAVWGPGDDLTVPFGSTWFRRPFPSFRVWNRQRLALYGPFAILFVRGLAGHDMSKQFVRAAAEFDELGTHRCLRGGKVVSVPGAEIGLGADAIEMLHFDAIGYERWSRKFRSRVSDPTMNRLALGHRRRQSWLVPRALGLGRWAAWRVFRLLYRLSPRQIRYLERRGLVYRHAAFAAPPEPAGRS